MANGCVLGSGWNFRENGQMESGLCVVIDSSINARFCICFSTFIPSKTVAIAYSNKLWFPILEHGFYHKWRTWITYYLLRLESDLIGRYGYSIRYRIIHLESNDFSAKLIASNTQVAICIIIYTSRLHHASTFVIAKGSYSI